MQSIGRVSVLSSRNFKTGAASCPTWLVPLRRWQVFFEAAPIAAQRVDPLVNVDSPCKEETHNASYQ